MTVGKYYDDDDDDDDDVNENMSNQSVHTLHVVEFAFSHFAFYTQLLLHW